MSTWVIVGMVWGLVALGVLAFMRGAFVPVLPDKKPDIEPEVANG